MTRPLARITTCTCDQSDIPGYTCAACEYEISRNEARDIDDIDYWANEGR